MSLLVPRIAYKPFSYPQAYEYWLQQQNAFWLHTEVSMDADIYDWRFNLTDSERAIIGGILKSFVQSEILIGDYWRKVADTFPQPEIGMMCSAFSAMESNHIAAYAYLNDSLGLQDFEEFLHDEVVMERLGQIMVFPTDKNSETYKSDIARSLAVFSAFAEGVALFSAFTILLSFAQRGLMKGVGQIIEFSVKDEALHARAGVWLFNTFINENKDLHGIKKPLYDAARLTVEVEDKFIDSVFAGHTLPNCNPADLKVFIRQRCNQQLKAMSMKANYAIDKSAVKKLSWFNIAVASDQHADFFASRVSAYAKTSGWDNMWELSK